MKYLKIGLAVGVIAVIAFFVIRAWITPPPSPPPPPPGKNQFIDKIEQEIQTLTQTPDDKFSKDFYSNIVYLIDDNHKQGKLGKDSLENTQWKENLSKIAYSAYADKFTKESFYVFEGTIWKVKDLEFIDRETKLLRKSPLLERGSPIDEKMSEIQSILGKYDEAVRFINSSKNFSYSNTDLSSYFPESEAQERISEARNYLEIELGNKYVNNCTRLHQELEEIPQVMFRAHVRYLDKKINSWSGFYIQYNSQKAYVQDLFNPIKKEIDVLGDNHYDVSNFESEYNRLKNKWDADAARAYRYFTN